jgi:hypothetical protein
VAEDGDSRQGGSAQLGRQALCTGGTPEWSRFRRRGRYRAVPATLPNFAPRLAASWGVPGHAGARLLLPPVRSRPRRTPHRLARRDISRTASPSGTWTAKSSWACASRPRLALLARAPPPAPLSAAAKLVFIPFRGDTPWNESGPRGMHWSAMERMPFRVPVRRDKPGGIKGSIPESVRTHGPATVRGVVAVPGKSPCPSQRVSTGLLRSAVTMTGSPAPGTAASRTAGDQPGRRRRARPRWSAGAPP